MTQQYHKLKWDSNFFSFNVGRLYGSIKTNIDLLHTEKLIKEHNSQLTYYSSESELENFVFNNQEFEVSPVDIKITYSKIINSELFIHESVSKIPPDIDIDKIKKLAIQSGRYSRFNKDKRIDNKKFEELYSIWILNSINGDIAKEVLVYQENNEIIGFITLVDMQNKASIGLIAVDSRYRGQGIGKALMSSAEKWFSNYGYRIINVTTQSANKPACKLYENCGYTVKTTEYIYHFWKKKVVHYWSNLEY